MSKKMPAISENFIFLKEMALLLGTSEGSLRGCIRRESKACPPGHTRIGRKVAWRRDGYLKWFNNL